MKSVAMTISGRVQGVWFRVKTKQKADELGICGSIRNLSDGSVYVEATGLEHDLQKFMNWCQHGPPLAHVENIKIESLDLHANNFYIVR